MFEHTFSAVLKEMVPEFEEKTGMRVNFETPAFPVYNQRADLELSTRGSAWDFLNITFIYSGRGSVRVFTSPSSSRTRATPPDWGADDFLSGAVAVFKNRRGERFSFPGSGSPGHDRRAPGPDPRRAPDPRDLRDLTKVMAAVHDKDNVKAFVIPDPPLDGFTS
jgi:multiple sugar transport system substrate-binding protein